MKNIKWIPLILVGLYLALFLFSRRHLHHGAGASKVTFYAYTGDYCLYPLDSIPLMKNVSYAWSAIVDGNQEFEWEDTLTLPVAPKIWPDEANYHISSDKKSCTRSDKEINEKYPDWFHKLMFLKTGKYYRKWDVAPDDPEGTYQFSVTISGKKFQQELKFIKPPQ